MNPVGQHRRAVWVEIVSQPNEQTLAEISGREEVSAATAYWWIFLAGFLFTASSGVSYALSTPEVFSDVKTMGALLLAALLAAAALVLSFALSVALKQWIAKRLGGTGAYHKLAYLFGAIYIPFAFMASLSVLAGAFPSLRAGAAMLFGLAFLCDLYLQVTAVKAVNRFGWKAALVSVLIPFALVVLFCAVAMSLPVPGIK